MPTVLLRLEGPLQSYAVRSRWEERATLLRPTKSAVVGLVANALGWDDDAPLGALAAMRFAVRADRPGHLIADEQTAGGGRFPHSTLTAAHPDAAANPHWYGAPRRPVQDSTGRLAAPYWPVNQRNTVLITKHYLSGGAFLAGLTTSDDDLAHAVHTALLAPARLLFLGRRSCPPAQRVAHGVTPHGLDSWPAQIPLLDQESVPEPQVWTEQPPGPETVPSPEQPPVRFTADDGHHLMHLRRTHCRPPAARRTLP